MKLQNERKDSLSLVLGATAVTAFAVLTTNLWEMAPVVVGLGILGSLRLLRSNV